MNIPQLRLYVVDDENITESLYNYTLSGIISLNHNAKNVLEYYVEQDNVRYCLNRDGNVSR